MSVVVIAGTRKGAVILRSAPDRRSWEVKDLALKGWICTAATRDAAGRTYVGVTHDVWGPVVMASDDLQHWEQLAGAPRYEADETGSPDHNRIIGATDPMGRFQGGGRFVDQIWKLHAVGDALYAGVSEAGLFRSDDRGKTWQPLPGLNAHPGRSSWVPGFGGLCAHSVLVDALGPERIWVGISAAGVFRSDDGGRTFTEKNEGVDSGGEAFCVHALAHDPADADRIFRQDHRGMYRTTDGGDRWERIESGLPLASLADDHVCAFGFPVAFDPGSGAAFAVPLEGDNFRFPKDGRLAVYRTLDAGGSWKGSTRGLPETSYTNVLRGALAVDRLDPCGVYLGTTSGALFGSPDGGESWMRLAGDLPRILSVSAFAV